MRIPGAFALAYPLEILVVNDGKPELASTKLHLYFLGYEPDQALSATELIEMANNKQYDLILSGSHAQLPMKRKEFLAHLKACSVMAGKC
jgi:hypothetical protein